MGPAMWFFAIRGSSSPTGRVLCSGSCRALSFHPLLWDWLYKQPLLLKTVSRTTSLHNPSLNFLSPTFIFYLVSYEYVCDLLFHLAQNFA